MAKEKSDVKKFRGDERRYLPRWEVNNRILYKCEDKASFQETRSRDINCSGASIYTDEDLSPNQKVKLTVYLAPDVTINVLGKVQWTKTEDNQNVVGINFDQMSRRAQDLILKYAFELNQNLLVKHWFKGWD